MELRIKSLSKTIITLTLLTPLLNCSAQEVSLTQKNSIDFKNEFMDSEPLIPANLEDKFISCPLTVKSEGKQYLESTSVDYSRLGWETRVAHHWEYFEASKDEGKVLVIDFNATNKGLSYRYLANSNTQNDLIEPWSSSKVMSISGAIAEARKLGLKDPAQVADVELSDLITSIHSYSNFGKSTSSSNSIATYFVNLVGREQMTRYFHDDWLLLSNKNIKFRGGYGEAPHQPHSRYWLSENGKQKISFVGFDINNPDPGAINYRCDECGLTGNKPMTTLALAEWLKRLASHERDALTRHPYLQPEDIKKLFYGEGHSDKEKKVGGMSQGISRMITLAVGNAIGAEKKQEFDSEKLKQTLDKATDGQWRVWQKIGWGPSETRKSAEYVILAHVCLPKYQGGREFSISAQVAIPDAGEKNAAAVGQKMQTLLNGSIKKLLSDGH